MLLELLAQNLRDNNFNLRAFLKLLVQSSTYQMSSRYAGEWSPSYVSLFARHFPRRLEGEEVHDAIVMATNMPNRYTVGDWTETVSWAMQLPDPAEPRSNGTVVNFLNAFLRGNRDTMQRSQSGSILQQINMMNDVFITTRNKVAASPALQAVSKLPNNTAMTEELFLLFLSRYPAAAERNAALAVLDRATTAAAKNAAIEDLAWALMNRTEFLFSY